MTMDNLSPAQLTKEGNSAYQRKDYQRAAQSFQAAATGFASQGEDLAAAEMLNNSSVAWLQSGDGNTALAAVLGTEAVFAQSGDTRRQAIALGNQAAALESLNRNQEAAVAYEQSADLFKEIGEIDLYIHTLQSLSGLQLRTGSQLEALATMQASFASIQKPTPGQRLLRRLLRVPFSFLGR